LASPGRCGAALGVAEWCVDQPATGTQGGRRVAGIPYRRIWAGTFADAAKVADVREVKQVRVRAAGPDFRRLGFGPRFGRVAGAESRDSQSGRGRYQGAVSRADVVVHTEPGPISTDDLAATGASAGRSATDRPAHDIRVFEEDGRRTMELHLEMAEACPWARRTVGLSALESDLQAAVPGLANVITHIEPSGERAAACNADPAEVEGIRATLLHFPELVQLGIQAHDLCVRRTGHELANLVPFTLGAATSSRTPMPSPSASSSTCARRSPTWGV